MAESNRGGVKDIKKVPGYLDFFTKLSKHILNKFKQRLIWLTIF